MVVSDRLIEFVNVASVIQTSKNKNEAKEPFVVGANKPLGDKLGWIYLQLICAFQKFRNPLYFHRFLRGTRGVID